MANIFLGLRLPHLNAEVGVYLMTFFCVGLVAVVALEIYIRCQKSKKGKILQRVRWVVLVTYQWFVYNCARRTSKAMIDLVSCVGTASLVITFFFHFCRTTLHDLWIPRCPNQYCLFCPASFHYHGNLKPKTSGLLLTLLFDSEMLLSFIPITKATLRINKWIPRHDFIQRVLLSRDSHFKLVFFSDILYAKSSINPSQNNGTVRYLTSKVSFMYVIAYSWRSTGKQGSYNFCGANCKRLLPTIILITICSRPPSFIRSSLFITPLYQLIARNRLTVSL